MKERTSKGVEMAFEVWNTSEDVRIKMEAQTDSTSFQFRTPGTARTKTDAQVAYRVELRRTWYGWKDDFNTIPMAPVSGHNTSKINGNHLKKLTSSFYPGAVAPSFGLWALYCVDPIRGMSRGSCTTL